MSDHIGDADSRNAEKIEQLERNLFQMQNAAIEIQRKLRVSEMVNEAMQTQVIAFEKEYRDKLAIAVEALELVQSEAMRPAYVIGIAKEALAKIQSK